MRYKVGDKVLIKSLDWYYEHRDRIGQIDCGNVCFVHNMTIFCEKIVTISSILPALGAYRIEEDDDEFNWTDEMFEGLVEEKTKPLTFGDSWECPQGYQFVDENGNVVNATKIILEKKKKEYPKTYEECCEILGVDPDNFLAITSCYEGEVETTDYELGLLNKFTSLWRLRVCRDAYWKLAGERMGLGKPWAPNWKDVSLKYVILYDNGEIRVDTWNYIANRILSFPTEEMRDAFYENFKELIESCKELL